MRTWTNGLLSAIAVWLATVAATACGQIQLSRVTYLGKVVRVTGTDILVKANNGAAVIASLNPKRVIAGATIPPGQIPPPQWHLVGTVRAADLRKGMYVRFAAKVDGQTQRTAVEPIKKLAVFTPGQATQFGLLAGLAGEAADPEDGADGGVKTYLVVGQIASIRNGTVTVEFVHENKRSSLKAQVAADAVVDVKLDNPVPLVPPIGADIVVNGFQVLGAAVQPIKVLVTTVEIRLPEPELPKGKPGVKGGDNKRDRLNPFAPPDAGGDAEPEPKLKEAEVPGKILKVN